MDRASTVSFALGALLIASSIYVSRRSTVIGLIVGAMGIYIALMPVTILFFPDPPLRDVLRNIFAD